MAGNRRSEPAIVITGPEPLLVRRTADSAIASILQEQSDPTRSVRTFDCSRKPEGGTTLAAEIAQAGAPSLFGDPPILRVDGVESADDATQDVIKALLADDGATALVVTHNGAARGRGIVNAATKAGATVTKVARPKDAEIRRMARAEAKAAGGTLSDPAEQWLVEALGTDSLELLLAAVRQAIRDTPGGRVGEDDVAQMFPQQAKVSSFAVVDAVWAGRTTDALRLLRGMEQRERSVAVSVVAAIAHGMRMMALAGIRGATPPSDLGIAPWQAERARDNARRWEASGRRIASVAARLPQWDADAKGGLDGGIALDDEQKMAQLEQILIRLATAGRTPGR